MVMGLLVGGCIERYEFNGREVSEESIAYDIVGVDTDNRPFRLSDHLGQYVLLNFGYTFCPDVCPLTLADLSRSYTQLLQEESISAEDIIVVFVTIDPERDTLDKLGPYVHAFHSDFYGVYIEDGAEMEAMLKAYNITVRKRYRPADDGSVTYLVDHSAGVHVINSNGVERLFFPYNLGAEEMAADLSHLLNKES